MKKVELFLVKLLNLYFLNKTEDRWRHRMLGLLAHVATYDTSSPTEQMLKSASKKYTKGSKIVGIRIYIFFQPRT